MKKIPKRFLDGKVALSRSVSVPLYSTGLLFLLVRTPAKMNPKDLRAIVNEEFKAPETGDAYSDLIESDSDAVMAGYGKAFFSNNRVMIALAPSPDSGGRKFRIRTVAHECFHAAQYIAHDLGFNFDQRHDEPVAYLMGWLMDYALEFMRENGFDVETGA